MAFFLTGATGLLGLATIKELQRRKMGPITAFVLPNDQYVSLLPQDVNVVEGDILDKQSLEASISQDDIVIHMAAYISIYGDKAIMEKVNVTGTKNVVDAAMAKKAKKLIYISTSHVLPFFKDKKIVESDYGLEGGTPIGYYETTKKLATDYVFSMCKQGLKASIIYPSGILSNDDPRLGEISTLLYKLKTGKLTYIVKGGYAFVDVNDVAIAIVNVINKGKNGEGYTISGGYLSIQDIDDLVVKHYPKLKKARIIPLWVAYLGLPFIMAHERLSKKKPLYTRVALKTLQTPCDFDTSKAIKELGVSFTPLEKTINKALDSLDKMEFDRRLK